MGFLAFLLAAGFVVAAAFFQRPLSAAKKLAKHDERVKNGINAYPVTVTRTQYKTDTLFPIFTRGNTNSQHTGDFVEHGEALAFSQRWTEGDGKNRRTVKKRIVALPLARDFHHHHINIEHERTFRLFSRFSDVETDSITFNKEFHVTGSSKDAVIAALAPRVQNALVDDGMEKAESVGFRTGGIFAVFPPHKGRNHDKEDAANATWLTRFRDELQSVTAPETTGDAYTIAPVSKDFLEKERWNSLLKLQDTAQKMPWMKKVPWLPGFLLVCGVIIAIIGNSLV